LRNEGKPEVLLHHYGECVQTNLATTESSQNDLSERIEGSGSETGKDFLIENASSTEGDVNSIPIQSTEKPPTTSGSNNDDLNSQQNHLQKSVKARAVPSIFVDDIDSSEKAALGLKKDELSTATDSKNAAVEASRPLIRTLNGHGSSSADLHSKIVMSGEVLSVEELLGESLPPATPSKTISVSAILQPFDMTQPCSAADCDKTKNPVCDSNNRTHKNLCLFKFYACKVHRHDGRIVELAYAGECKAGVNLTHNSLCNLARFNCQQRVHNATERVLVHIEGRSVLRTVRGEKPVVMLRTTLTDNLVSLFNKARTASLEGTF
ncbi:Kazal-type serine protease inhibitor domain protein, partial [Cooperia oncophora]